jgi:hypothetical protein
LYDLWQYFIYIYINVVISILYIYIYIHAWHFRTRNCTFKMWQIFPEPRVNFGNLVANLRIVKLLKLRELILVRVFLEGYLTAIGRQMVSHGSKWYQYCHGYGQFFATGPLLARGIWAKWRLLFEVEKVQQLRLV